MSMTPSRARLEATRLKHIAEEGRVIVYRCNRCRNVTHFLASDVVDLWGPEMKVYEPPASCGKCGAAGYMTVRFYVPTAADIGHLVLRRPAGVRQLWKDEVYAGVVPPS